jgi:signal transduction histidine kinase
MRRYYKSTFILIIILLLTFSQNLKSDNEIAEQFISKNKILKIDSAIELIKQNHTYKNDSFLILAKQTLIEAKDSKYHKGINQSYFQIARIYDFRHNTDSAIRYYKEGLEYNFTDIDLYSNFLLYLAERYRITGNVSSSLEVSLTLKSLVESNQTKRHSYQVYNLLALSYLGLMEYDLAFENFNKSAELALLNNNEAYAGVVYANIGKLFYDQFKLNEALEYLGKGALLEEKYKLYNSLGNSFNIIADIYLKLNNESQAYYYLKKAKENNIKSNNRIGLSKTYFVYGKVHSKKNNIDSAIYYLNKSIGIAELHSANSILKDAYLSLSKIYAKKQDYVKAYFYHDKFFMVHNKMYNVEKISKAKALEQKLIHQQKESELIEFELKKQETINRLQNLILVIGLVGAFIILIYLIRFKRLNIQYQKSKEKAEESDKLKSRFLQTISHEIRTPLNGILGFSDMIVSDSITPKESAQINDLIHKNSDDLISTIENLVDIAHLSTNQYKISKSKFELSDLLESVYKKLEDNIIYKNKKDIKLELKKNATVEIYSDKSIVTKILQHLVKNALLFTQKGSIQLGYNIEKSNVVIFVKDTGIGISQEKIDIIFSPFRNAEENINIKVGGTGLGLTIVNEFIQILDGKVWVGSELKKGTTFFVSLPIN